jgi:hypothetical protein
MSIEDDYSSSIADCAYLKVVVESLAVQLARHVQKIKTNTIANKSNHIDTEYVTLYIDEISNELLEVLYAKMAELVQLTDIKTKMIEDKKNEN